MARKASVAAPKPEQAVVSWDAYLAQEAEVAVGMEASAGGGGWFSTRAGVLSYNDIPIPGNQMAVIVLDHLIENTYYEGAFNAEVMTPPKCFAFGRDLATMKPHDVIFERHMEEHEECSGCPNNEWGSAGNGRRGKACGNRRRMSMISAGDLTGDRRFETYETSHFETSPVAFFKLPVTSVKTYANYVRQIGHVMSRPLFGVISLVKVVPDPKSILKVNFTYIDKVPDHLLPILVRRRNESQGLLEAPYNYEEDEPQAGLRGRKAKF